MRTYSHNECFATGKLKYKTSEPEGSMSQKIKLTK